MSSGGRFGSAWPGRAGELYAKNLLPTRSVDRLQLDSETGLRLGEAEFLPEGILLTVPHRRTWRTEASLGDRDVTARARGLSVVRIDGEGPSRGRFEDGESVRLLVGGTHQACVASDYVLAATTALVASGATSCGKYRSRLAMSMQNGRANPAAVRDRFRAAGSAKKTLGDLHRCCRQRNAYSSVLRSSGQTRGA
jgi:hypothetical protein